MIILAITVCLAAIGVLCWLLFTLAVFALPVLVGVMIDAFSYNIGAGVAGAVIVAGIAAFTALAIGQILFGLARALWLKLGITALFVAPAMIARFHTMHGVVKHPMPSPAWQLVFAFLVAVAVGITAYLRLARTAPPSSPGGQTSPEAESTDALTIATIGKAGPRHRATVMDRER